MKVHYYEIPDCDLEYIDKEPAIIAPEGTDEELLQKYDFVQLLDGRWCHYMDMDEKLHMMKSTPDELLCFNAPETFSENADISGMQPPMPNSYQVQRHRQRIIYYDIENCKYEFIDGIHAIIAPEETDIKLLKKYDFVQLLDGRWCHYMSKSEVDYYMSCQIFDVIIFPSVTNYCAPPEKKKDDKLTILLLIIMLTLMWFIFGLYTTYKYCEDECTSIGKIGSQFLNLMRLMP